MVRKEYFENLRKGIELEPITAFEKNYFFAYKFKLLSKKITLEEKIIELKKLSLVKINNNPQPYEKRRNKKHPSRKKCFVCRKYKSHYQHHIIVFFYDNGINRIPICERCHKKIHSWL